MFAPLVAQAKSTGPQLVRAVDHTRMPRGHIGNQAMIRFLAQRANRTGDPTGAQTNGSHAAGQGTASSWDFSKIPLHPPGQAERPLFPAPRLPIQAKLKVGSVNDPREHEADRVADQVMRMPAPEVATTAAPPQVSRKCAEREQEEKLQKKEAVPATPALSEAPLSVHEALRSPGQPLDAATRAYFEPRFGRDFGEVRVRADAAAAQSAQEVDARAYTVAHKIAFDSGSFAPGSREGRQLLAHELTHVAQQGQGKPLLQREPQREAKYVSPRSRDVQPAKPVYDVGVNPNNVDWRGQNHTLQEALDEAFKKVSYDDNGVSTGITKDQLRESAWVKTSYGKTVPVEWKGPRGAEVSIDVAHNAPAPDIAHVGWQRPGKARAGIFSWMRLRTGDRRSQFLRRNTQRRLGHDLPHLLSRNRLAPRRPAW
jgi:Domain of unknown function (DUF4157)/Bacterial toxin 47